MAIPIINKILSIIYLYCFNIYGRLYCICDYIHIVFPYCRGHVYRSQLYVYLPIICIYICSFTHMMITITYLSRLIFCFSIFFLTCMMVMTVYAPLTIICLFFLTYMAVTTLYVSLPIICLHFMCHIWRPPLYILNSILYLYFT